MCELLNLCAFKGGHNSLTKDKLWWSDYLYQISQRMIEEEGNQKAFESRIETVLTRQTPASSELTCHQSIFEDDNVINRINWIHQKRHIFFKNKMSNLRLLLWFLLEFHAFSMLGNWVLNWVIQFLAGNPFRQNSILLFFPTPNFPHFKYSKKMPVAALPVKRGSGNSNVNALVTSCIQICNAV